MVLCLWCCSFQVLSHIFWKVLPFWSRQTSLTVIIDNEPRSQYLIIATNFSRKPQSDWVILRLFIFHHLPIHNLTLDSPGPPDSPGRHGTAWAWSLAGSQDVGIHDLPLFQMIQSLLKNLPASPKMGQWWHMVTIRMSKRWENPDWVLTTAEVAVVSSHLVLSWWDYLPQVGRANVCRVKSLWIIEKNHHQFAPFQHCMVSRCFKHLEFDLDLGWTCRQNLQGLKAKFSSQLLDFLTLSEPGSFPIQNRWSLKMSEA